MEQDYCGKIENNNCFIVITFGKYFTKNVLLSTKCPKQKQNATMLHVDMRGFNRTKKSAFGALIRTG